MRMIAIHAQTERKRLDRSVRCAEKRRPWARKQRLRGLIRPDPAVCATAGAACGRKSLSSARIQAIFTSNDTPLGECRFRYYDSLVGQYASPDPIGLLGGLRSISYVPVPTKYVDFYALTCNLPDGQRYVSDILQVACRLTSRSPDFARWASVFRPERCLSSRKRPKSGGSSLEPAAFWPGRAAFPRGRRTCPAAFVQLGHGSWSCA